MILGITGGSGSGKTTLLRALGALGGLTLDCDEIYHRLLREDAALLDALREAFPESFSEGILDRKALGARVFSNPAELARLNALTHGAVRAEVLRALQSAPALVGIDAIALHEGGLAPLCDKTVAVVAPRETRIARLMRRDGISREYAEHRLDAQPSDEWFRAHCDAVLENDGTEEEFYAKCMDFMKTQLYGNTAQRPPDGFACGLLASFPSYRPETP